MGSKRSRVWFPFNRKTSVMSDLSSDHGSAQISAIFDVFRANIDSNFTNRSALYIAPLFVNQKREGATYTS